MKISINKNILLKGLTISDMVISSKNMNTVLSNCLINIIKDKMIIYSTDNDIAIKTEFNIEPTSSFSFLLNSKKLSNLLKDFPDDDVLLKLDENILFVKSKSKNITGNYKILCNDINEYPEMQNFSEKNSFELDQNIFKNLIKKVIFSASIDTIKPVFNGIFFNANKNIITLVATDSRRLSLIHKSINSEVDFGDGIIIPLKAVSEIYKLLTNEGKCIFSFDENHCFFRINNTEIISRIVDSQFPNYKQVIPKESKINATIKTKKLIDAVKRSLNFTKEPANAIVLSFYKDKLIIEANASEIGDSKEEINISNDIDEEISVGLNAQFLIDALKEIDSSNIKCGVTGNRSPILITPEDNEDFISVIMPIQISSDE